MSKQILRLTAVLQYDSETPVSALREGLENSFRWLLEKGVPVSSVDAEIEDVSVSVVPVRVDGWASWAEWSGAYGKTDDKHSTKEAAEAVCRALRREGLGGGREIFPLRTGVEPICHEITP